MIMTIITIIVIHIHVVIIILKNSSNVASLAEARLSYSKDTTVSIRETSLVDLRGPGYPGLQRSPPFASVFSNYEFVALKFYTSALIDNAVSQLYTRAE